MSRWLTSADGCTRKQEVVGSNPARVACDLFFHISHSESSEYAVLYTRRCIGQTKATVYRLAQEFHQPIHIIV